MLADFFSILLERTARGMPTATLRDLPIQLSGWPSSSRNRWFSAMPSSWHFCTRTS